jgi:hypothetical protein
VRDHNGQAPRYVYYETEAGRRTAANLLTRDEARRIAAGIAKLPDPLSAVQREGGNPLVSAKALSRPRRADRLCSGERKRRVFFVSSTGQRRLHRVAKDLQAGLSA